jgi:hypothetical protein
VWRPWTRGSEHAAPSLPGAFVGAVGAVEDGIENLLPAPVFTDDVFEDVQRPSGIANKLKILPEVRKSFLAERLCDEHAPRRISGTFARTLR